MNKETANTGRFPLVKSLCASVLPPLTTLLPRCSFEASAYSLAEAVRLEACRCLLECARSEEEGKLNGGLCQDLFLAVLGSDAFSEGVVGAIWSAVASVLPSVAQFHSLTENDRRLHDIPLRQVRGPAVLQLHCSEEVRRFAADET